MAESGLGPQEICEQTFTQLRENCTFFCTLNVEMCKNFETSISKNTVIVFYAGRLFSPSILVGPLFSRKGRGCEKKKGRRIICTRKEEGEKKDDD